MSVELYSRMNYEPAVLFVGRDSDDLNQSVFNYHWNLVVTPRSASALITRLDNGNRIFNKISERREMNNYLLDSQKLNIISLADIDSYEYENLDDFEKEDIETSAEKMFERVVEAILYHGIILIEDFEDPIITHKLLRRVFSQLQQDGEQVHFFNVKDVEDKYINDLVKKGIAVIHKESLNDYFYEFIEEEDADTELDLDDNNALYLYINAEETGKISRIDKADILESQQFAEILNIKLLSQNNIRREMYSDYFYAFLRNSVKEPQWYGYDCGFNIHRDFEKELYAKVKRGLESIGSEKNRPLLLIGQSGTGKSIALAALAYKVFYEKRYPVVYINNPDVVFGKTNEVKKGKSTKTESSAFKALDALLKHLEDEGAAGTLLLWDTSCYGSGRDKIYQLFQALRSRARKVFLVATAYEQYKRTNALTKTEEYTSEEIEESVLQRKFNECYAKINLTNEVDQLKDILKNKCHLSDYQLADLLRLYPTASDNFLAIFYRIFFDLRNELSKGIRKEAGGSIEELIKVIKTAEEISSVPTLFAEAFKKIQQELKNAGINPGNDTPDSGTTIEANIVTFIKCIAIASKFKLSLPYDLALRILGTYNADIISTLTRSTFFDIRQVYGGNYTICIRTPLEAEMYLRANDVDTFGEIECIGTIIKEMQEKGSYGQQEEVKICESLVRVMGPNNEKYKDKYRKGYKYIIEILGKLRTERQIWEPLMVAQEITYIREYYGKNEKLPKEERIEWLEKAVSIEEKMISRMGIDNFNIGLRNALIVEGANSRLLLYHLEGTEESIRYKSLGNELRMVIRTDSQNYYAYVTLIKALLTEYSNVQDSEKKLKLMESMLSIIDEIRLENEDINDSWFFQDQVTKVYQLLDNTNVLEEYIDELAGNNSAAGLYVVAKKKLRDNGVDFKNELKNDIQKTACEYVYDLFHSEKYREVVNASEACQYMLLNLIWLIKDGHPVYQKGEYWLTKMDYSTWGEILDLCEHYLESFCTDDIEDTYRTARNIRYIKALSLAEIGEYVRARQVIREIKEDSTIGVTRAYTKHMICEPNGTPRTFNGKIIEYNENNRTGYILIEEFRDDKVYFYGPHLKAADLTPGRTFTDIEIGLNNVAPKAFRNIKKVEG